MCLDFLVNVVVNQEKFLDKIQLYTSQFLFIFFVDEIEVAQDFCEICSASSLFFQVPPMTLTS